MRRLLCLALASTFLTAAPAVVAPKLEQAQAQGLFDALFPRSAERRRERLRERIRREREAAGLTRARVKRTVYYNYKAEALAPVAWTSLATTFAPPAAEDGAVETPVVATTDTFELKNGADLLGSIDVAARKDVGEAMLAHYKANPEFLWVHEDGEPNYAAMAVLDVLAGAESLGLNEEDYAIDRDGDDDATLTTASTAPVDPAKAALQDAMGFEFALTTAALRYALDARHGTVDPNKISGYHDFPANKRNAKATLAAILGGYSPARELKNAHPKAAAFQALVDELKALDNAEEGPPPLQISNDTFLRPGQTNDELAEIVEGIRRKASPEMLADHAPVFAIPPTSGIYSADVVALVKDFQRASNLGTDGIIGRNTINAIVGTQPENKREKVLLAMERLRWLPDTFGKTHVFINQPGFRATYMSGGEAKLSMRAIVGKKSNQTNFFHDEIEYVEYNPYWGVPRSILVNEKLPKLRENPGYLDERNYEITNQSGRRVSGYNIDWWSVGADFPYNVRQRPGARNALGELKIMFPNKHHIYMHDTPSRNLFKRDARALSHGCVRLSDPWAMAAAVLKTSEDHVRSQIARGANAKENVPVKIPVYVSYFTAWPTTDGTVEYFGDMYGRDDALGKAMTKTRTARTAALDI
jgi:murein L,D-transpeptidase YcbB/YkuD